MNRQILTWPNSKLRRVSAPVVIGDPTTEKVIQDLADTFRVVEGYGLAAPQVGHAIRALVISPLALGTGSKESLLMLNPTIELKGEVVRSREACMSIPDIAVAVKRHSNCTVTFQDIEGLSQVLELEGLSSFCVQHEIDHLDGMMTLDRIPSISRSRILKKRTKERKEKEKIEKELRLEFASDHDVYSTKEPAPAKKRVSKISPAKKKAQRKARKINHKKRKKK